MRTKPTGEFGGKVQATLGDNGQEELRAIINTSIIEDTLALKPVSYTHLTLPTKA